MQNLKVLTSQLPLKKVSGSMDIEIKGISFDSRKVAKDFLFVAINGLTNNGHNFIPEAISKGAIAVVGEEEIDPKGRFTYIRVKDSALAMGLIASEWFDNPSASLKVIGVTGTKGKTTTVHIIYHLLTKLGKKAGMVSSIAAKIGDKEIDTGFHVTNPDAISLHGFLREMVSADCEYAVLEVSSHGIAQKRIAGVNFEIGVLTNIAPEHLDYHKTFEEYKNIKMTFVKSAKISIVAPSENSINILPGDFNNINGEVAIKTVVALGFDEEAAIKALESFRLPEGRLDEIETNKDFRVVVDFAHTPESLEAALRYLRSQTKGKVISVFGCAGERDPYKRPKMGKISAKFADITILTAEDPRSEDIADIISQIKSGSNWEKGKIYEIPDRSLAIKKAIELAGKGDIVGIFGKGHEKSMNLDGTHELPWSDHDTVKKYLNI